MLNSSTRGSTVTRAVAFGVCTSAAGAGRANNRLIAAVKARVDTDPTLAIIMLLVLLGWAFAWGLPYSMAPAAGVNVTWRPR